MMEQEEGLALQIIKRKRTKRHRPVSSTSGSLSENSNVDMSSSVLDVEEEEDIARCLILLAQGDRNESLPSSMVKSHAGIEAYKCKTCERRFGSFQALGGHRASHKKPKLSGEEPAIVKKKSLAEVNKEEEANTVLSLRIPVDSKIETRANNKASKAHECSICGAEFSSGQALGGHMRRHRLFSGTTGRAQGKKTSGNVTLTLDLNLPAEPEELDEIFPFSSRKQISVFSASSLVGCQY